jgi:hypothetical protein
MKMLLAILLGNLIYFVLQPYLPDALAHNTFQIDAGLLVDLGFCAVIYVIIRRLH